MRREGDYKRGEEAPPFSSGWKELALVAEKACNLRVLGVLLAWMLVRGELLVGAGMERIPGVLVMALGWCAGDGAVQRPTSKGGLSIYSGGSGLAGRSPAGRDP